MYRGFILTHFPRLLTQLDRDADSPYYGSFDRNFWHYKIRDFSSAIVQQAGLCLALMYKYTFDGNRFQGKEKLKDWACASINFWSMIQLDDGSFNEYYPGEHGFPPTAFGLYSTASICRELDMKPTKVIKAMKKAAEYIIKTPETEASNQQIAGITGIFLTAKLLDDDSLYTKAVHMLNSFLDTFNEEGWFPEYRGFDLGYLSVTADQLVEIYRITNNEKIMAVLEKIIDFVRYFVTPAGTIGGEYNSRNTEYYLPYHLEFLRGEISYAGIIADKLGKNIENTLYFQKAFDDRYICHYVLYSFIKAQLEYEKNSRDKSLSNAEQEKTGKRYFEDSGVWVGFNNGMHTVINLRKGGLIKITDQSGEIFNDFGYRIKDKNIISVTNWLNNNYRIVKESNTFNVQGNLTQARFHKVNPFRHFILRILARLFKHKLIGFLKNKMIFISKESMCYFERKILLNDKGINIEDKITSPELMEEVYSADKFSLRHVSSSKSFHEGDLIETKKVRKTRIKELILKKSFSFDTGKIIEESYDIK